MKSADSHWLSSSFRDGIGPLSRSRGAPRRWSWMDIDAELKETYEFPIGGNIIVGSKRFRGPEVTYTPASSTRRSTASIPPRVRAT